MSFFEIFLKKKPNWYMFHLSYCTKETPFQVCDKRFQLCGTEKVDNSYYVRFGRYMCPYHGFWKLFQMLTLGNDELILNCLGFVINKFWCLWIQMLNQFTHFKVQQKMQEKFKYFNFCGIICNFFKKIRIMQIQYFFYSPKNLNCIGVTSVLNICSPLLWLFHVSEKSN